MCYSVKKSCYFTAKEEAAQPDTVEAANGRHQEVVLNRERRYGGRKALYLHLHRSSKHAISSNYSWRSPRNLCTQTPSGWQHSTQRAGRAVHRGAGGWAHLQDDGELLRRVAVLHAHRQPHLECRQLLRKEGTVLLKQEYGCRFGFRTSEAASLGTDGLKRFIVSKNIPFNFCWVCFLMKKFSKDWSDTTSFKYTCIFQYKRLKKEKERLEKQEKASQKLWGKSG